MYLQIPGNFQSIIRQVQYISYIRNVEEKPGPKLYTKVGYTMTFSPDGRFRKAGTHFGPAILE